MSSFQLGIVGWLFASLALFGCATGNSTVAGFRDLLAFYTKVLPRPLPCFPGYAASAGGYIVSLADWAEQAGLRPGDRITSIAGVTVSGGEERTRALAGVAVGGPLVIVVNRQGHMVTVSLPCRDESAFWAANRRLLEAGARGDWDGCIAASLEVERLGTGLVNSLLLEQRFNCVWAKDPSRSSSLAQLDYEISRLQLRESRYDPGGIDRVRAEILVAATRIKIRGFGSLAADLEDQLHKAQDEARQAPVTPSLPTISKGTGFVVKPDGTLVTAFHIVRDARTVTVKCPGQAAVLASLGETAANTDLAVLRTSLSQVPYLSLARSRSVRVGDPVFTIGFPVTEILGGEPKFSDGAVSALSGPGGEATLIQMTVPVQPGNSGGPLMNAEGDVVGVVTSTAAIRPFLRATGTLPQNINWAIKAEYAMALFDQPLPLCQDE